MKFYGVVKEKSRLVLVVIEVRIRPWLRFAQYSERGLVYRGSHTEAYI